ncbi:hypothetical protein N7509_000728 [Penicillium cosmopolitanum]|uniref:Major facilitator superfamily (MFS) profile domain-containing protein n=1 Tax=Penicillium cosmopolitanum TaxID=1131564 RepID=A0A9W9WB48_9EURO|nr:uncharacterized protein N7509_000728 [Penicillium cosmopolitanum]KAJ5414101.1 hypothetical protein N7509_000728 [Penicillium cosmopolitanum]
MTSPHPADEKRLSSSSEFEPEPKPEPKPEHEQSVDSKSEEAGFAPITHPFPRDNGANNSTTNPSSNAQATPSRSLERSWSLNDGTSLAGDEGRAERISSDEEHAGENFMVGWDEDDALNPRNMSKARRWMVVIIISMGSLCVTCCSSMYTVTYDQLIKEFNCSKEVATLGLSFFIWGLGIGPLFLSPLSEFYGRRNIYMVSFSLFLIWLIPCAVAKNIQTMLICRFFNGLSGAAFLSVAGGTVGDMFDRHELAFPMMLYTASPFIGPEVGPLVGGFINAFTTWRWTFYVLLIWSGVQLISLIFLVPETYHPVLLRRKAQKLRQETGDERWKAPIEKLERSVPQTVLRSMYRPILLLTLEPMCLNLCIFSAILLGILYLFFGAFQLVFLEVYGFSIWQRGLCFLGLFVGMVMAILSDPLWRRNYVRLERQHQQGNHVEEFQPEWRLPPAILGGPLVTIGLFIFAWTIYPDVHWIAPIIGSALFGAGEEKQKNRVLSKPLRPPPSLSQKHEQAQILHMRSAEAQVYNNLGYHWATSLLAFLTLAMLPFPYIFYRYGSRIRKHSRFATSQM